MPLQVSALFANPWLEHIECHELLAGVAGVLVELQQHETPAAAAAAAPASSSGGSSGSNVPYSKQLQELFRSWGMQEMRRWG